MKHLVLIILTVLLGQQSLIAQKAVKIYVVRHAEKAANDPRDNNPDLSLQGNERAIDLMKSLSGKKIDSIYSTAYKRTVSTVRLLAKSLGIAIKTYTPAEQAALAKHLIVNGQGKEILIVGHSNTLLPIIEAFGAAKPVKELTEEDYDYIFEITITGTKAEVKVNRYGKSHHSEHNIKMQ